jgi:hypothetical protein
MLRSWIVGVQPPNPQSLNATLRSTTLPHFRTVAEYSRSKGGRTSPIRGHDTLMSLLSRTKATSSPISDGQAGPASSCPPTGC